MYSNLTKSFRMQTRTNEPATAGRGAEAVRDPIAQTITMLSEALRKSLTWTKAPRCLSAPNYGSRPAC
jgi:hypothetical protein